MNIYNIKQFVAFEGKPRLTLNLIFFLACLATISNAYSQSIDKSLWRNYQDQELNYFDVCESFEAFQLDYDESIASDELKKKIKKFLRYKAFWEGRTETVDVNKRGLYENYSLNLLDWSDVPECVSVSNPDPWVEVGPFDMDKHVLGRVDCVWMDPANPDVIYAGTPNSGLFKTTNGTTGDDIVWTNVTDVLRMPGLGCASIAVDPLNNDILYVGTGNSGWLANGFYGPGILKSSDGGQTWAILENFVSPFPDVKTRVHNIKIHPTTTTTVYASARNGVYRSENSGDTWEEITPDGMENNLQFFISLEFDPSNPSIMYIGSANPTSQGGGATAWKTLDGGDSWTQLFLQDDLLNSTTPPDNLIVDYYETDPWQVTGNVITVVPDSNEEVLLAELAGTPSTFGLSVLAANADYLFTFEADIPEGCKLEIVSLTEDGVELETWFSMNEFATEDTFVMHSEIIPPSIGYQSQVKFVLTTNSEYVSGSQLLINSPFVHPNPVELELTVPASDVIYVAFSSFGDDQTVFFKSVNGGLDWEYLTQEPYDGIAGSMSGLGRNGIAVTDISTNHLFSAGNTVGEFNGSSWSFSHEYEVSHPDVHADVRVLEMYQYQGQDILLTGNDGGASISYNGEWESLNGKNFGTNLFYDIGTSEKIPDRYIVGALDNGTFFYNNELWKKIANGDGGASSVDPFNADILFYSVGGNERRKKYNPNTGTPSIGIGGAGFGINFDRKFYLPITTDPYNMGVVYFGSETGLWRKTYDSFEDNSDGPVTLVASNDLLFTSSDPYDVDFCNDQVLYYSIRSATWNIGENANLYRSDDAGENWSPISSGNNASSWYGASSVLAEPGNPNNVWSSHMGLPNDSDELRVMASTDAGQTWNDWSKGLPALPANDLAYQQDANIIYVGTDVGVYFRHRDDPQDGIGWQCFNEGLPVCLISDVDVINCSQELVVSTFGRGVWKTKLIPAPDKLITTTQTWSDDLKVYSDIVIDNNAILTITGTLSMAEGKKITVMQGAKLIVNGGTITNGCGKLWRGIYAEGSSDGQGSPNSAARIIIRNGAEISYARTALNNFIQDADGDTDWSTTGGLIQSYNNATFINNKRDAQFLTYQNENNNGDPIRDYSYFRQANFIIDDNYLEEEGFTHNITNYRCEGIKVEGCNFSDDRTGDILPYNRRTGILCSKGSMNVNKFCGTQICDTGVPNTFTSMNKGVHLNGTGSALF